MVSCGTPLMTPVFSVPSLPLRGILNHNHHHGHHHNCHDCDHHGHHHHHGQYHTTTTTPPHHHHTTDECAVAESYTHIGQAQIDKGEVKNRASEEHNRRGDDHTGTPVRERE